MTNNSERFIGISKAPSDPKEKKEWVTQMMNFQIQMWIDDKATCIECGHTYTNIDDFTRCSPRKGYTKEMSFVCNSCYPIYKNKLNGEPLGDSVV